MKPIKLGVQIQALCCSYTGSAALPCNPRFFWQWRFHLSVSLFAVCRFTHRFQVHHWVPEDKKNADFVEKHPYCKGTAELVVHMAKRLPSKHHTITMDNFFTSARAFRELRALGFHAVGTVKSKSDIPAYLLSSKKDSKRQRGTARMLRSTDRMLLLQEWQDGGLVRVLSTGHVGYAGLPDAYKGKPGVEMVGRWRKDGHSWTNSSMPCPPAVVAYQEAMRGVDMADAVSPRACVSDRRDYQSCFCAETGRVHRSLEDAEVVHVIVLLRRGCRLR